MNILVQKPIEKRLEEVSCDSDSMTIVKEENKPDNSIAIKDVNGLHFEADLDAIQKEQEQEDINIARDMERVGINPKSSFESIEKEVLEKYNISQEPNTNNKDSEKSYSHKEENVSQENDYNGDIKNSISVYKKAYLIQIGKMLIFMNHRQMNQLYLIQKPQHI